MRLDFAKKVAHGKTIQGNLDPALFDWGTGDIT